MCLIPGDVERLPVAKRWSGKLYAKIRRRASVKLDIRYSCRLELRVVGGLKCRKEEESSERESVGELYRDG